MNIGWVYPIFPKMEIENHGYIQILWAIYDHGKWVSVVKEGENFFNIFKNMHFWSTQKIVKFRNMSVKVYEYEICCTSV